MGNYVILSHSVTLILSLVAMLAIVFSFAVRNGNVACVMQGAGFLFVVATVVYALLSGAELREILTYVLVFVVLSAISFVPREGDVPGKAQLPPEDAAAVATENALCNEKEKEGADEL